LDRISNDEQAQLRPSLSTFFGSAKGEVVSGKRGVGHLLFDQFSAALGDGRSLPKPEAPR
jgi:hypothetical protein